MDDQKGKEKDTFAETEMDSKNAMRAFLQRAEVKLSTMHRIGGIFLNGAGLLVLFPVFFKEAVQKIIFVLTSKFQPILYTGQSGSFITLFVQIMLGGACAVSLILPLIALFLLLKEIVSFYFVGNSPGSTSSFFPRLSLFGLAFPKGEADEEKKNIMRIQYASDLIHQIVPVSGDVADKTFPRFTDDEKKHIIPEGRSIEELVKENIITDHGAKIKVQDPLTGVTNEIDRESFEYFNIALGMAGFVDRTLQQEVARTETTLSRHALVLRRLVIRYMKALSMFIWTTILSFFMVSLFLGVNQEKIEPKIENLLILSIGYLIWAPTTIFVVGLVIKWIKEISFVYASSTLFKKDPQLLRFEQGIKKVCWITFSVMLLTTVILIAHFQ